MYIVIKTITEKRKMRLLKMLEMICAIPENVGWVMVGAAGAFALMMAVELGKIVYYAIRSRLDDEYDA
jgi:hypothetical protein